MSLHEVGDPDDENLVQAAKQIARPLKTRADITPLVEKIAHAKVVMLGESSHGTHEFYEWRRLISQELIEKKGFRFIAVEGDWPPSSKLNSFLHGKRKGSASETLRSFHRWPTWMWANQETVRLAEWMKNHNFSAPESPVSFYGLDVYSLFESIDAALFQLAELNPFLARKIRSRYDCFAPFRKDERSYARSLIQFPEGCLEPVTKNLKELLRLRLQEEETGALFDAQQNARVVANAENYYRVMVHGGEDSWNVRDRHMLETLEILLQRHGPESKAIVWAHNSHIGDYRATDMADAGQINLGGLAREKFGPDAVALLGFGTYQGTVIAAKAWDGPTEIKIVPNAANGSYETALHRVSQALRSNGFWIDLKNQATGALAESRGHRAIGVVYDPRHEQHANYVPTRLALRYDAFLYFDKTTALSPLRQSFDRAAIPETWPRGV